MEQQQHNKQLSSTSQISKYQKPEEQTISFPNISATTIGVIKHAIDIPIRDELRKVPEKLIRDATTIIGEVLVAYCGATSDGTHSGVVSECVALMTHKFAHLSIYEIREAFRLAAVNQIDVNLTAYKGVATVYVFGQVMSAYDELRRPVAHKFKSVPVNTEEDEKEVERKRNEFNQMVIDWYNKSIESKGASIKSIDDIPFYYYDTLSELGLLKVDIDTKKMYMEKAIILLKNKFQSSITNLDKEDRQFVRSVSEIGPVQAYFASTKSQKSETVSLAKKLYLFDSIKSIN